MNCLLTLDRVFETSRRFDFSTRSLLGEKSKRREVSKTVVEKSKRREVSKTVVEKSKRREVSKTRSNTSITCCVGLTEKRRNEP